MLNKENCPHPFHKRRFIKSYFTLNKEAYYKIYECKLCGENIRVLVIIKPSKDTVHSIDINKEKSNDTTTP